MGKPRTVLVIGWGNVAPRYWMPLRALVEAGEAHVAIADVRHEPLRQLSEPGLMEVIELPPTWATRGGTPVPAVLRPWDVVFNLTPPQRHAETVRAAILGQLASRDTGGAPPCRIVVEKPLDTDPSRARELIAWLHEEDPRNERVSVRVLDHYRAKRAITQLAAAIRRDEIRKVTAAHYFSFENQELWPSESFDSGYLLEHGIHAPASLDAVVGVERLEWDEGNASGATHLEPPRPIDTLARAVFSAEVMYPCRVRIPFTVWVGKGVPVVREQKWLGLAAVGPSGQEVAYWTNIATGECLRSVAGGPVEALTTMPDRAGGRGHDSAAQDGHAAQVPQIVRSEAGAMAATLSIESAADWLEPLALAAQFVRGTIDQDAHRAREAVRQLIDRALAELDCALPPGPAAACPKVADSCRNRTPRV